MIGGESHCQPKRIFMVNIWSLIDRVVDTRCALCHAPGHAICADCLTTLPRNTRPCARCACRCRPAQCPNPDPVRRLPGAPAGVRSRGGTTALPEPGGRAGGAVQVTVSTCSWVRSWQLLWAPSYADSGHHRRCWYLCRPDRTDCASAGFNQAAELARWLSAKRSIYRGWHSR